MIGLLSLSADQRWVKQLRHTVGGGGGDTLTASNFAYDGAIRMPSVDHDMTFDLAGFSGRVVGGDTHLFVTQTNTAAYVGRFSPVELNLAGLTPNPTYTSAPQAVIYAQWGYSVPLPPFNGAAVYDPYQGLFGKSYSTAEFQPIGTTPGDAYYIDNAYIAGAGWHDNGTGHCCFYASYSSPYGNINPEWNLVGVDLPAARTAATAFGVFRNETGEGVYGSGVPRRGAQRTYYMLDGPAGEFCHGSSNGYTAQGASNQGPSLACSASWPQSGDTANYASSRTGDGGRTSDIVATDIYLLHYGMYGLLNTDGTKPGGQDLISARRPARNGGADPAYIWENNVPTVIPTTDDPSYDLDPLKSGDNSGTWTTNDGIGGCNWIDLGTQSGYVCVGVVAIGHEWYRTTAAKTALIDGVTPITYDRNVAELSWETTFPGANADIVFTAVTTNQHVTVAYVDPGAINQSLSISVSSPAITVHLATNGVGAITSTAAQIKTLWDATGAATALATTAFDLFGDGSAVVSAFSAELVAGGPAYCPRHNVDSGVVVTGPASSDNKSVMLIYNTDTLTTAKNSAGAIKPYSTDPESFLYVKDDISGASAMHTVTTGYRKENIGPSWYEPASQKLYVMAASADSTTVPGLIMPLVHRFSVTATSPKPSGWPLIALFGSVLALSPLSRKRS